LTVEKGGNVQRISLTKTKTGGKKHGQSGSVADHGTQYYSPRGVEEQKCGVMSGQVKDTKGEIRKKGLEREAKRRTKG